MVMPHWRHIYAKSSYMAKATLCAYPQSDHVLQPWKCVMRCCDKCPSVHLPDQETDDQYTNTIPSFFSRLLSNCMLFDTWKASIIWKNNFASANRILLHKNPQKYTLEIS